jgi:hypothetical protein
MRGHILLSVGEAQKYFFFFNSRSSTGIYALAELCSVRVRFDLIWVQIFFLFKIGHVGYKKVRLCT